eukprot:gene1703-biopygen1557
MWIKSFLNHRTQQVILEGAKSEPADILSGVPQGAVLGPLLFLAYINDLPDSIKTSASKLFADNSLLFKVIVCDNDSQRLQEDLTALEKREETWQMSFNPSKCSVIRIAPHKKKKAISTQYYLHGHLLDVVDASKYLGVTITNKLSWDTQVSNTAGKASRTISFLRHSLRECTSQVKDASYKAMVRPILEYPSTVWDPCSKANIQTLEEVQRRAARYVFNNYSTKTPGCVTKMLSDLAWKSLESQENVAGLPCCTKCKTILFTSPHTSI